MKTRKILEYLYKPFFKQYLNFIGKEFNSSKNALYIWYCNTNFEENEKETKYNLEYAFYKHYLGIRDHFFFTLFKDGSVVVDIVLNRRLDPDDHDYFVPNERLLTKEVIQLTFKEIINILKKSSDYHSEYPLFIEWDKFPVKQIYKDTFNHIEKDFVPSNDKEKYEKEILIKQLKDMYKKDFPK